MTVRLPPIVQLTADATLPVCTLRAQLSISRQLLHLWTKRDPPFPQSHRAGRRRFYITSEVQAWLIAHGCEVHRL